MDSFNTTGITSTTTTTTTSAPQSANTTTVPNADILPSIEKCNYYIVNQTNFDWLDFGNPYGGIPQNLLINAVSVTTKQL